jgi:3-hydroxyisobutyrate dehydrogenase-like beta-hydroxyacid dehydrogenase
MTLLDIPLARGEAAAVAGKLLIYGAGDEAAFEACRPAFTAFASDIFHLGAAGAGQVGKMVNNLLLWACISANDEGLRLGEALGVDPAKLREALRHGSGQNWAMDHRAEESGMPWAEKDMSLVLHEADLARLSLPLAGTIKEVIKGLKIRMGLGLPKGSD